MKKTFKAQGRDFGREAQRLQREHRPLISEPSERLDQLRLQREAWRVYCQGLQGSAAASLLAESPTGEPIDLDPGRLLRAELGSELGDGLSRGLSGLGLWFEEERGRWRRLFEAPNAQAELKSAELRLQASLDSLKAAVASEPEPYAARQLLDEMELRLRRQMLVEEQRLQKIMERDEALPQEEQALLEQPITLKHQALEPGITWTQRSLLLALLLIPLTLSPLLLFDSPLWVPMALLALWGGFGLYHLKWRR